MSTKAEWLKQTLNFGPVDSNLGSMSPISETPETVISTTKGHQVDLLDVASDEFRQRCVNVAREIAARGFDLSTPSFRSLAKFREKTEACKLEILSYLDRTLEGLRAEPTLNATQMVDSNFEKESLLRHFWRTGTRLGNQDFLDQISDGDVVEVYSLSGIQLYRSWSCFQICSYSLSDLLMFEWDELYERPSSMVSAINSRVAEAVTQPSKIISYNLPEYLMTEKFDGHSNKIKFQMKNIIAVLDVKTGEPVGVCSTGRAHVFVSQFDGCNLSFL